MSDDTFQALMLEESDGAVSAAVRQLTDADLPDGDVLVRTEYSTLNYKDGMVLKGLGRLVRNYPHVPGIDLAGVAVSSGSACSSGKVKASPVLQAMGVGDEAAGRALRISLGWNSTAEDVDKLVAAWKALYLRLNGEGRSATQEAVSLVSA